MWKNIGSNWTLNAVQILVFMVLTRYVVDALYAADEDLFGVWEAILAAGGPLQLLILGVPMATVRAVSASLARSEPEEANRALGTSVTLTLLMGVVTLFVGFGVFASFDAALLTSDRWELNAGAIEDARKAFWIFVGTLAAGFFLRLPYALYDAHHDFVARNLIMGTGMLLRLGLTVLLLSWNASLTTLAAVQTLVGVVEFGIALGVSSKRHPDVRFRPGRLERSRVMDLLSFSVFALLLNMGAMLAFRIDALVVGSHLDAESVAIYGIGNKIFDPFINLLLAIGMVVMPMASSLAARNETAQVRDILLKWSKVATCVVFLMGTYLFVLGPEFLSWWIGENYDPLSGTVQVILMGSFFLFLPVRGVALPILMGLGRPRKPAFGLLGMGLANLALSLVLVREHGVLGVALGTAIPNVLFAVWFAGAACRETGVGIGEFLGYAVARPLLGLLPALGLLVAAKVWLEPSGFIALFSIGLVFTAVYGVGLVLLVWNGDRYLDVPRVLRTKLGRS